MWLQLKKTDYYYFSSAKSLFDGLLSVSLSVHPIKNAQIDTPELLRRTTLIEHCHFSGKPSSLTDLHNLEVNTDGETKQI